MTSNKDRLLKLFTIIVFLFCENLLARCKLPSAPSSFFSQLQDIKISQEMNESYLGVALYKSKYHREIQQLLAIDLEGEHIEDISISSIEKYLKAQSESYVSGSYVSPLFQDIYNSSIEDKSVGIIRLISVNKQLYKNLKKPNKSNHESNRVEFVRFAMKCTQPLFLEGDIIYGVIFNSQFYQDDRTEVLKAYKQSKKPLSYSIDNVPQNYKLTKTDFIEKLKNYFPKVVTLE